jgi:hypothetical protein
MNPQAVTLTGDYPHLAGLPRLADIVPTDRRWGVPPQNQTSPIVPALPPYRGWCHCENWFTQLSLVSPDIVLAQFLFRLTAIDAETGEIIWQDSTTDFRGGEVAVFQGLVIDQWGRSAVELAGGARVEVPQGIDSLRGPNGMPPNDPGWVTVQQYEADVHSYQPDAINFLARYHMALSGACRVGQQYFAAAKWSKTSRDANDTDTYFLFAFDLDKAGKPIPSKLKVAFPKDSRKDVAAFYACQDPVRDNVLMQDLATGGTPALEALLKRVRKANSAQITALVALCLYSKPAKCDTPLPWNMVDKPVPWDMADKLLTALEKAPRPDYVAPLAAWLATGDDDRIAVRLACLLARCGGPVAKDALLQAYDSWTYVRRVQRQPPYPVCKPGENGSVYDDWSHLQMDDGSQYAAFTSTGLASWRDIYLGLDPNGDGDYEEVLYTGLGNSWYCRGFPVGQAGLDRPLGPLRLEIKDGRMRISHHEPEVEREQIVGAQYVTSMLDLSTLRADTDKDGLPDLVEAVLLLDPLKPDCDGDGIRDGEDALPNVDQAKLGRLERGAQRAIIADAMILRSWQKDVPPLPWSATYYDVKGAPPLAVSLAPYGTGICIHDSAEMQHYRNMLRGSNDFGLIEVQVFDLREGQSKWPHRRYGTASGQYWAAHLGVPAGTACFILLDYPGYGEVVQLAEVSGELFPVSVEQWWIS